MPVNISGKILGVTDDISNFYYGLTITKNPFVILDILIIAVIIYWGYFLIKETRAIRILYGIGILGIIMILGQVLHLVALNWMLNKMVTVILVAIPVVFQPELRSALERLGRTNIVGSYPSLGKNELNLVIKDLMDSIKILSKNKTGALIVLVQKTGLKDIIDTGKPINAQLTSPLLLTIFTHNSPLHDGAVIVNGNKIVAAKCMLPLSEDEFSFNVGTRHRAAVGLSSQTDAIVLVVSEETGSISISYNGQLYRDLVLKEFEDVLTGLLQNKTKSLKNQYIKTPLNKK